ncbi:MAG: sugar transferase [Thermodesulfobacteriota bacterium]
MVHQRIALFIAIYRGLDAILVVASLLVANALLAFWASAAQLPASFSGELAILATVAAGLWSGLLKWNGAYLSQRGKRFAHLVGILAKTHLQAFLGLVGLVYLLELETVRRPLLVTFLLVVSVVLLAEKALVRASLRWLRGRGHNYKRVLIVGSDQTALDLAMKIENNPELGFRIKGCLVEDPDRLGQQVRIPPVLGTLEDLTRILHTRVVDEVFLCLPMERLAEIQHALAICEDMGINGRVVTRLYEPVRARVFPDEILDIPLYSVSTHPPNNIWFMLKSVGDFVAAAVLLVILAPVFVVIGLAIKLTSPGPVFFLQRRTGYNGRKFAVVKFRTMVDGADRLKAALKGANEMDGPIFKIRNDPRVTAVGRFLRRTSLDELPQLINVLKGEMSLVGPRPLPVEESVQIVGARRRRLSMKPGITGLWQVSGRSEAGFERLVQYDLEYVDHWSLELDLRILLKTVWVIMLGRGAY